MMDQALSGVETSTLKPRLVREDDDVFWIGGEAQPIPSLLAEAGVHVNFTGLAFKRPAVCFVPVSADRLGNTVRELRQALGEHVYLVIVTSRLSAAWIERVVEFGADDVVDVSSSDAVTACVARARRALNRARAAVADRTYLSLERDYLQACIDNLPTPIFFKNADGVYVGCNTAFAAFIGRPVDGVVGRSVFEVAPQSLAARYQAADDDLLVRGGTQVYESEVHHSGGRRRHVVFHKAAMQGGDGSVRGIAGAILDITERKMLEAQLIEAAERDPLTNAYNRRKFFELAQAMTAEAAAFGRPVSVAVIDVDQFKLINDRLGHAEGDNTLRMISTVLEETIGDANVVARAGGEEFYAFFPYVTAVEVAPVVDRMRIAVQRNCSQAALSDVAGTISIGLADFDPRTENLDDALKRADYALYVAKDSGRNRVCIAD